MNLKELMLPRVPKTSADITKTNGLLEKIKNNEFARYHEIKKEVREQGFAKAKGKTLIALEIDWKRQQKQICEKCSRTEKLTLDHIIPWDIARAFGYDWKEFFWPENFRILCELCNRFKGNQLDFTTPKTKELLLKMLEKI